MPRVIIGADSPPQPTEELTRALADELVSPKDHPLPLIVERLIRGTKSRHVWVVWDRWGDLDEEERTDIIVQAYAKAEGDKAADNISIALGFLPKEAIRFGVVPFVLMLQHPLDQRRPDYGETFAREAEKTILGSEAKELRYPTEAEAEQAVERLHRLNPEISWRIHDEQEED